MFDVADDPDEHDLARADRAVGEALDQVAQVGDLVRDARGAGEEDAGAVGVEAVVAAVGAFEGGAEGDAAGGVGADAVVEEFGDAGVGVDDETDVCGGVCVIDAFWGGEDAVFDFFRGRALFGFGGGEGGVFDPGDGEGVGFPDFEGGEAEVGVGAGFDVDVFGEVHRDSGSISREGFHGSGRPAAGRVIVVEKTRHAA